MYIFKGRRLDVYFTSKKVMNITEKNEKEIKKNNKKMTQEQLYETMDALYPIIGDENLKFIPTVEMLKSHITEKNFSKYVSFLLYLEEKINNKEIEDYNENKEELNNVLSYISKLFQMYIKH